MEQTTTQGPAYNLYTFTEDEFKQLLGIDDPGSVLTVEHDYMRGKTLTVRIVKHDTE